MWDKLMALANVVVFVRLKGDFVESRMGWGLSQGVARGAKSAPNF